jgi:hypothetical protein
MVMTIELGVTYTACGWSFDILSDTFPSPVDIHIIIQIF